MNVPSLLRMTGSALSINRHLNCWSAGITRKRRKIFLNTYPTCLVLPDGSSINIDYDEPRQIITLPVNIEMLSEEDKRRRLEERRPVTKAKIVEEYQDDFDETEFIKLSK